MKHRILSLIVLITWLGSGFLAHWVSVPVAQAANSDWFYVSPDLDGDGLPNTVEESGWCNTIGCFQTNSLNADSDNDGLTDGEEKLYESDPLNDASPGIYVIYQDDFQTKEYYPWQPYGHKMIARGDNFDPPRPDNIDRQKGHGDDLDAAVVRRGTTFHVGGPLSANLSVIKSDSSLDNLNPVQDPYSGQWRITIPPDGTVGKYTLTLAGNSLDLFVVFELPAPTGELTQLQIDKFLYDDDLSTDYEDTTIVLADRQYPTTDDVEPPPYNNQLGGNTFIAEGWSYKFRNHQYNRYILEDYVISALNGHTNQKAAISSLTSKVDELTVFRNPRFLLDSWTVLNPGSNPRQECSNIAALLTTFNRTSGIPAQPIVTDWRHSSFDHSTEIWVNNEWRVYRGYNKYEIRPEPNDTPTPSSCVNSGNWPACGTQKYRTKDWWGRFKYKPWHSGGGGWANLLVRSMDDWTHPGFEPDGDAYALDYRWASWDIHQILLTEKQFRRYKTVNSEYWQHWGWTEEPVVDKTIDAWNVWPDPPPGGSSLSSNQTLSSSSGGQTMSLPNVSYLPIRSDALDAVQLGQVTSEYTVDSNGNGQDDQLVLEMEVTASQEGDYWLLGQLSASANATELLGSGGIVAEAVESYHLTPGTQTIQLVFSGTEIALSRIDGPYQLSGVWITDVEDPGPTEFFNDSLDYLLDSHTTQAYQASGFETYGATLSGNNYSHSTLDSNGDGLSDTLAVSTIINIDQPGSYTVEGDLYDAQGKFISHATWTGTGPDVTLNFDNVAGTVGPYTLQTLNLSNTKGEIIDQIFTAYTIDRIPELTDAGLASFDIPTTSNGGGIGTFDASFSTTQNFTTTLDSGNLRFDAEVNVTSSPGNYRLEAWLVDANGDLVTWATGASTNLGVGTHTLSATFDGTAIRAHGVGGPYQVVAVKIIDTDSGTFNVRDSVDVALTTQSYTLDQFATDSTITINFEDFMENGSGKWAKQSPWDIENNDYFTAHTFNNANHTWVGGNADATLELAAPIDFSGVISPALRFQTSYNFGSGSDTGYVEASTDGNSWDTLLTLTNDIVWSTYLVDLKDYIDEPTVHLRFRLESAGGASGDGWHIDDVRIVSIPLDDWDEDGIPDVVENNQWSNDADNDGTPNYMDLDSDADGKPDADEGSWDSDGDGIPNFVDNDDNDGPNGDFDGDGIPNGVEGTDDLDGDGDPNQNDIDADGDTIPDSVEAGADPINPVDSDGDGSYDFLDLDSDDDTISDEDEAGDADLGTAPVDSDGDGTPDYLDTDSDDDTVADSDEAGDANIGTPPVNTDALGQPDYLDDDSDNDGISDSQEAGDTDPLTPPLNTDGADTANFQDDDSDNDGIDDAAEWDEDENASTTDDLCANLDFDQDNDGIPTCQDNDADADGDDNYIDADSDDDGINDVDEGTADIDGDDLPNFLDLDSDGDGDTDADEGDGDVDGDGTPNYIDPDDNDGPDGDADGDGIPNSVEDSYPNGDTDGLDNRLDTDSDNDGIPDSVEAGVDPTNPVDSDGDGTPDYLDPDSDGDQVPDSFEGTNDPDNDGIPNYLDDDDDGDGIPTWDGTTGDEDANNNNDPTDDDTDFDGVPNYLDNDLNPDYDGDTILNTDEDPIGQPDFDNDGWNNVIDVDSDGDGIPDMVEAGDTLTATLPIDTDTDGAPDFLDLDSDDDSIPDSVEAGDTPALPVDSDNDGTPDYRDDDSDGDGIDDSVEGTDDPDGDTIPNYLDDDSDGDGILDSVEGDGDPDGDTTPNFLDDDSDGDGIDDSVEGTDDPDGDATPNFLDDDSDGDGIDDSVEGTGDPDSDTIPNFLDDDSDGDGIPDSEEGDGDPDTDSIPNFLDDDSDGDGIPDATEWDEDQNASNFDDLCGYTILDPDAGGQYDSGNDNQDFDQDNDGIPNCQDNDADGDGTPNFLDLDSDDDYMYDSYEAGTDPTDPIDNDGDELPDYLDVDSDDDSVPDSVEVGDTDPDTLPVDTDNDGAPDYLDPDSDDDAVADFLDVGPDSANPVDTDSDGSFDFQDTDSDSDGIPDGLEAANVLSPFDTDNDGIPDFRDTDSDNDGIPDADEWDEDEDISNNDDLCSNTTLNQDSDDIPNCQDNNADGDDLDDYYEGYNFRDTDSDSDGKLDADEGTGDDDGDGVANFLDPDDQDGPLGDPDGDGIPNTDEDADGNGDWTDDDSDGDGTPNYLDIDSDGDGISDADEWYSGPGDDLCDDTTLDQDGDGIPNCRDNDADGDGTPNYLDLDSDADTLPDSEEGAGAACIANYQNKILADTPIAYWRLGEASGTTAANLGSLGSAVNGTYQNGVTLGEPGLITGDTDTAASFDGNNDLVSVPDNNDINTGGPYTTRTIELWFNADSVASRQVLFEEGGGSRGLNIYIDAGELYLHGWNLNNDDGGQTSPWGSSFINTPISADTTYHVVMVLEGDATPGGFNGTITGYLNGASFGSVGGIGRLFGHGNDTGIGGVNGNTRYHNGSSSTGYFDGVIDEVAIYDVALSPAQIQNHYTTCSAELPDADNDNVADFLDPGPAVLDVAYTYTPPAPAEMEVVTFTTSITPGVAAQPITYTWNFGDGTVIDTNNPVITHSFAAKDTYTVTITATNGYTAPVVYSDTVTVGGRAIDDVSFTHTPSLPLQNDEVTFTAAVDPPWATPPITYTWNFGDGSPAVITTSAAVTHSFTGVGLYTVQVTADNDYGPPVTYSDQVGIGGRPVDEVGFTYSPAAPIEDENVTFTGLITPSDATQPVTYTWSFGDGSPAVETTNTDVSHSFAAPGGYSVQITATNGYSQPVTYSETVIIGGRPITGVILTQTAPATPQENDPVSFEAQYAPANATQPVTYTWDFGDGSPVEQTTTSTTTHTFTTLGTYTVTVTADNGYGSASESIPVDVDGRPITDVTLTKTAPVGPQENDPVSFEAQYTPANATQPVTYTWNFGDGSPVEQTTTGTNTHTYTAVGIYTAVVTASNGYGSASDTLPVGIGGRPITDVVLTKTGPASPQEDDPVSFEAQYAPVDATQPVTYTWNFGDGSPVEQTTTSTTTHTFATPGTYTVTVTADNVYGFDTDELAVAIDGRPVDEASFVYSPAVPLENEVVDFTATITPANATQPVSYMWDFSDGTSPVITSSNVVTHSFASVGSYTVWLTVVNGYGPLTVYSKTVTVDGRAITGVTLTQTGPANPQEGDPVNFDAQIAPANATQPVTYTWNFGDGSPVVQTTTSTATHTFATFGSYTVVVTANNGFGSASDNIPVDVDGRPVTTVTLTKTAPASPQEGDPVSFEAQIAPADATQPVTYTWNFGDGSPVVQTAGNTVTHTFNSVDNFTVVVTASNAFGFASDSLPVGVGGVEVTGVTLTKLSPAGAPVSGQTVTFDAEALPANATVPINYTWDFGDGTVVVTTTRTVTHVFGVGTYTVTVTADNGFGSASDNLSVTVNPVLLTEISFTHTPTAPIRNLPVSFTSTVSPSNATEPITYTWDFGDGSAPMIMSAGTDDPVQHTFATPGTYTVTVTADNGYGAPVAYTDVVDVAAPAPGSGTIYLPLIMVNAAPPPPEPAKYPDLVVESVLATTDGNVQVVIKNQGDAAVTNQFWVDLYVDPNPVPTAVNHIWNDGRSDHGIVWGITAGFLPALTPGGSVTLTLANAWYESEPGEPPLTNYPSSLPAGTPIYVQVDSANDNTNYGGVLEEHEVNGGAYNNIKSSTVTAGVSGLGSDTPATADEPQEDPAPSNLPSR